MYLAQKWVSMGLPLILWAAKAEMWKQKYERNFPLETKLSHQQVTKVWEPAINVKNPTRTQLGY
jgi:hypothetical protein